MGQRRITRWVIVVAVLAVLASLPYAVGRVPAAGSSITAGRLLARIQASAGVGYSGYAEATGSLALPVTTGEFSSAADLFRSTTDLRVWWRGDQDWRVDDISPSGEQDVHAVGSDLWTWNYESNTGTLDRGALTSTAHLPRADDLVPANLARRVLSQAVVREVTRLDSRRIAGNEAAGIRYVPAEPQSTISQVDVWALPGTGLPVAVTVYGKGDTASLVSSTMLDLSAAAPSESDIAYLAPPGVTTRDEQAPDLLTLAGRVKDLTLPSRLGGLNRDPISPAGSSVVVYGAGVTVLIAIPVFGRTAGQLNDELTKAVGTSRTAVGLANSIGPMSLMLTNGVTNAVISPNPSFNPDPQPNAARPISYLLVGTVTPSTLQQAATDLLAGK